MGSKPAVPRLVRSGLGLVLLFSLALAGSTSAQDESRVFADGPWRDLEAAEDRLVDLRTRLSAARSSAVDVQDDLDGVLAVRRLLTDDDAAYAVRLRDSREKATALAIEAYIGRGNARGVHFIFESEDAADLSFRNSLIVEHADATVDAARTYADLQVELAEDDLLLATRYDDLVARRDAAVEVVAALEAEIEDARWVVTIARIHAEADAAFAEFGRRDPTRDEWASLTFCESTWNYGANTGNGFFGAYQFDETTWYTVGGTGFAHQAASEEQDARARLLYARRGSQPWPICGRFLP